MPRFLSCDCNGVLSIETSTGQPLSFRCQIGHRYSMSSGFEQRKTSLSTHFDLPPCS